MDDTWTVKTDFLKGTLMDFKRHIDRLKLVFKKKIQKRTLDDTLVVMMSFLRDLNDTFVVQTEFFKRTLKGV